MITQSKKFFIAALEKALNGYLSLDPESAARLKNLTGKVIKIEMLNIEITFYLVFTTTQIQLAFESSAGVDTVIKGAPLRLFHMAMSSNRKQFFADDVIMEGDLTLAQHVIDLFDQIDIDWEEYLSRLLGDVPAHHVGNAVRKIKTWQQQTQQKILQDINEYVHEEISLFPAREALQDFFADVDHLRMDVDRLAARLLHLQTLLDKGSKK